MSDFDDACVEARRQWDMHVRSADRQQQVDTKEFEKWLAAGDDRLSPPAAGHWIEDSVLDEVMKGLKKQMNPWKTGTLQWGVWWKRKGRIVFRKRDAQVTHTLCIYGDTGVTVEVTEFAMTSTMVQTPTAEDILATNWEMKEEP